MSGARSTCPVRRFWEKVEITETCWRWLGHIGPYGYPVMRGYGKIHKMHRFAYEQSKGSIPAGLTIDHLCRNRWCVNPAHLEAVTTKENVLRGVGITAQNAVKTHCKHGHEFTPENTRHYDHQNSRHRQCFACSQRINREYKKRLRERRLNGTA